MAPPALTPTSEPARESARFTVEVGPPPTADALGGGPAALKLDWLTDVGRTGVLLQWEPVGRDGDAGVPPDVARALAVGLCAAGVVAGCTLDVPDEVGPTWTAVDGGHACRFARRWWDRPRVIGLLASERPDVAERLFEDDGFPWALEQQTFFLSASGILPQLDGALVAACLSVPIRASVAQLAAAGVQGLLVAGVDGDVAGLYALDPGWRSRILGTLARAVVQAGGRWATGEGVTPAGGHAPALDAPAGSAA